MVRAETARADHLTSNTAYSYWTLWAHLKDWCAASSRSRTRDFVLPNLLKLTSSIVQRTRPIFMGSHVNSIIITIYFCLGLIAFGLLQAVFEWTKYMMRKSLSIGGNLNYLSGQVWAWHKRLRNGWDLSFSAPRFLYEIHWQRSAVSNPDMVKN